MSSSILEQPIPRTIQARENRRFRLNHQRLPSIRRSEKFAIQNDAISKKKEAYRSQRLTFVLHTSANPAPYTPEKIISSYPDDETVVTVGSDSQLTMRSFASSQSASTNVDIQAKEEPKYHFTPSEFRQYRLSEPTSLTEKFYHNRSTACMKKSHTSIKSSNQSMLATKHACENNKNIVYKTASASSAFPLDQVAIDETSTISVSTDSSSSFRRRVACGRESSFAQYSHYDTNHLERLIVEASGNSGTYHSGLEESSRMQGHREPAMFSHFHFSREIAYDLGDDASFSSSSTRSSMKRVSFSKDTKEGDGRKGENEKRGSRRNKQSINDSKSSNAYGVFKGISEGLYNMFSEKTNDEFDAEDLKTSVSNLSCDSRDSLSSNSEEQAEDSERPKTVRMLV